VEGPKKIGAAFLSVLIACSALAMAANAWYRLAANNELPIHARHGDGTAEPFSGVYFIGIAFYALVATIGVGAIIALIDQGIGIPIVERHRTRIRRLLAVCATVSLLLPLLLSVARQ